MGVHSDNSEEEEEHDGKYLIKSDEKLQNKYNIDRMVSAHLYDSFSTHDDLKFRNQPTKLNDPSNDSSSKDKSEIDEEYKYIYSNLSK